MTSLVQFIVAATFSVSGLYGLQDPDFCTTPTGSTWGTVESVRDVPLVRDIHAFDAEALEHKVTAETAEELAVRLDAGPVVIFTGKQIPRGSCRPAGHREAKRQRCPRTGRVLFGPK